MVGIVELGRAHADVAAADLVAEPRERVILRDRRQQDDAVETLALEEMADVVEHRRRAAVDRADEHREIGPLQRLEDSLLDIEDHLRIGIVVDEADQEVGPQRERAGLGVRT